MRTALEPLDRYIAANRIGKRILFTWQGTGVCPSDLTIVVALDDGYSIGLLSSRIHCEWARAQSSTLEDRMRYTPTSAFETFAWPSPTDGQREEIGRRADGMIRRRQEICADKEFGLTALYNEVDDGAYVDLRDLHLDLDKAVAAAYGWPASAGTDGTDSNRRLLELNKRIAVGEVEYAPFA